MMTLDLVTVGIRALAFMSVFQAAGTSFFLAVFGQQLTSARFSIGRLGFIAACGGLVLTIAHLVLDAPRLAGHLNGLWDPDLQRLAWTSKSAASQITQALGSFTVAQALSGPARRRALWASLGGAVIVIGFLLTGHTSVHPLRSVLASLLTVHLLIAAFWFGSLVPLVLVTRLEPKPVSVHILRRFSVIATWLVPFILVAGLLMAWILAGNLGVLRKPYGELLIAKFAGFLMLMLLAAYNKWLVVPSMAVGTNGRSLRWSIAGEYALIVTVLSVTAALTALFSPE
jgi:copper resistance protein D